MLTALLIYAASGVLVGIVAGLLGLGGGLVVVPILLYSLPLQGIMEYNNHLALGTSMASIVFTSISSVRAHHGRGAVLWPVVLRLAPGIIIGTFAGGHVVSMLSSKPLSIIFAFFLFYMSVQMFLDIKPKASRSLPGGAALAGVGGGIGFVSSFVGIGGGSMTIPFLSWCNTDMRLAIGTSAGVGFPIALAGTASYIVGGWDLPGLPEYSLGFVYLPALLGLVSTSMLFAPLGAKISHKVSVKKLKRFFAVFLFLMGLNMAYKILT
ncbi:MAG: sulfite exporter TauE/SafE family protein [Deltaproteobacteria bacterium]|jgi:uncharacterized membrane protein YfcA|nr:sulfite exporter TauE/SafE family protein [Deltaproteobacteria bacterium]